jgi:hypothetical protein
LGNIRNPCPLRPLPETATFFLAPIDSPRGEGGINISRKYSLKVSPE